MSANQEKYDAKKKRIEDAIALKEPDQIPIMPSPAIFPVLDAGYTVAESIYDDTLEVYRKSIFKYLNDFDPDSGVGVGVNYAGRGPLMEMIQPKNSRWAGMPGNLIDENSIQQYIEFPFLEDDEFDEFFSDRTGWTIRKALPRSSAVTESFKDLYFDSYMGSILETAASLSRPEVKETIQKLWEINDVARAFNQRAAAFSKEVEEAGYPIFIGGKANVPFDAYSNGLRGTLNSLADIYERPEEVERYMEEYHEKQLAQIRASKGKGDGKHVFMSLHKGMDGFMSNDTYEQFYWRHLREIIEAIVDAGKVPYIFAEGKYNSRLKFLTEVPKGKVYYRFESVDMAEAKRVLGDIACISGGMPAKILNFGTKQDVIDETKRIIDACAPGGGFVFETACGLDYCSHENVQAMFDTVREYGKH